MIVYPSLNIVYKFWSSILKLEGYNLDFASSGILLFFNFSYKAFLIKFFVESITPFFSNEDIND